MAISPSGNLLVTYKACGDLELRLKRFNWTTTFTIPSNTADESAAISSLCFDNSGRYVFAGRFNGFLDVYSVSEQGMTFFVRIEPGGGSIISLAANPSGKFEIAVGSEDGGVRFITMDEDYKQVNLRNEFDYSLPSDPAHYAIQRGSTSDALCLSLCWKPISGDPNGLLVSGDSEGGLKWFNGTTKKVIGRGSVPTVGTHCRVWTIQIVANGQQVICGDSRGRVTLWCSKTFTKLEENQIEGMTGDIWCSAVFLAPDKTENIILGCAGGTIGSMASLVSENGPVTWMPCRGQVVHSHDVKSIVIIPGEGFISASTDSRFCVVEGGLIPAKSKRTYLLPYHAGIAQNPTQFFENPAILVSRSENQVDFWNPKSGPSGIPSLGLKINTKPEFGRTISCAVSKDRSLVAVSNVEKFSVFRITVAPSDDDKESLNFTDIAPQAIPLDIEKQFFGAEHMCFLANSICAISQDRQSLLFLSGSKLIRVPIGKLAMVFKKPEKRKSFFRKITTVDADKSVSCLRFSENGRFLALGLHNGSLAVITSLYEKKCKIGATKPFKKGINCLSFLSDNRILVSTADTCFIFAWNSKALEPRGDFSPNMGKNNKVIVKKQNTTILASGFFSAEWCCVIERRWETEFGQLPTLIPRKMYGM